MNRSWFSLGLMVSGLGTLFLLFMLFNFRHQMFLAERSLHRHGQAMMEDQKNLHILQSEWSYLTQPSRIHRLVKLYFPYWKPVSKEKFLSFESIQTRAIP